MLVLKAYRRGYLCRFCYTPLYLNMHTRVLNTIGPSASVKVQDHQICPQHVQTDENGLASTRRIVQMVLCKPAMAICAVRTALYTAALYTS